MIGAMPGASPRLLRLLSMFQSRRYWSGGELAQRLEVTPRTLRRDVERLRELGYQVESTPGVAGGYRFSAGGALPPLMLEDDEAVAIAVALSLTSAQGGMQEPSVRALAKLIPILPRRLRARVEAVQTSVTPLDGGAPITDSGVLALLLSACRDRELVRLNYCGRSGEETIREVEPGHLVPVHGLWYLAAWDRLRGDWRTFRLDRIKSAAVLRRRFTARKPPAGGYAAYVARSISREGVNPPLIVLLQASLQEVRKLIPAGAGTLEEVEGGCRLIAAKRPPELVCALLASSGIEFRILEPLVLLERLQALRDRLSRALGSHEDARGGSHDLFLSSGLGLS